MAQLKRYVKAISLHGGDMVPAQCRMARAALALGVRDLAEAAKVSTNTITRFERGEPLKERTLEAIRHALEAAGVIFIEADTQGPGVRLNREVMQMIELRSKNARDRAEVAELLKTASAHQRAEVDRIAAEMPSYAADTREQLEEVADNLQRRLAVLRRS